MYFHSKESHSSLITHKIANDISRITNTLTNDIGIFMRGILNMIGAGTILVYTVPETTLLSFVLFSTMVFITSRTGAKVKKYRQEETEKLANTSVYLSERLSAIKLIKISDTEGYEKNKFDEKLLDLYKKVKQLGMTESIHFGVLNGYGQIILLGIMTYSGFLVSSGLASSDMLAAALYNVYLGIGAQSTFNGYIEMSKTSAILKTMKPYFGESIMENDPLPLLGENSFTENLESSLYSDDSARKFHLQNPPSISFENISFRYKSDEAYIFENQSFIFHKGKVTAIIGSSGSGKSTILNLICKLYGSNSGKILIDDIELGSTPHSWVQANISYVTQEMHLFSGSIYENIVYGNQGFDISETNVKKILKQVEASFVEALPRGIHTILQENAKNLSGGQKQRLILARAFLKDPQIIIMDEPTSALDKETEGNFVAELEDLCKGRTVLLVTHKLQPFLHMVNFLLDLDKEKWSTEKTNN